MAADRFLHKFTSLQKNEHYIEVTHDDEYSAVCYEEGCYASGDVVVFDFGLWFRQQLRMRG